MLSISAMLVLRSVSNSASGKVGARSRSRSRASSSGRCARRVSKLTVTRSEPPEMPTRARSASMRSAICWRSMPAAPRRSMEAVSAPTVVSPCRLCVSPMRSTSAPCTTSPRAGLGSNASCMPLASVWRVVWASILAGLGSNAAIAAIACLPW
ncbi:hypothetical protein D3C72_1829150 [compost metagenome]